MKTTRLYFQIFKSIFTFLYVLCLRVCNGKISRGNYCYSKILTDLQGNRSLRTKYSTLWLRGNQLACVIIYTDLQICVTNHVVQDILSGIYYLAFLIVHPINHEPFLNFSSFFYDSGVTYQSFEKYSFNFYRPIKVYCFFISRKYY